MHIVYTEDELEEIIELIEEYDVEYDGCNQIGCTKCSFLTDCYYVALRKQDSEWAESVNYGGCNNEEEFWDELLG